MTEPARPRLVFLGLPRTGKSTFLGAFWALIQSPFEASVREASFSGDRSYVQRLADQVARGEEPDRTALDADEELAVEVYFEPEGLADLLIPDTSGESLRVLAERRIWYPRLLAACTDATAILVFIHPERLRVPQRIVVAAAGEQTAPGEQGESAPEDVEFHPGDAVRFQAQEHACTAAELIEWMAARLPGVLATLESNRDVADFEVFGVSAQGGALEDRDELLAKGEICDRVFAEDRDGRAVSLVDPIRWAIWGS